MQSQIIGGGSERYIKKELLGNGGFAKCYVMINVRTKEKFAGKIIKRRDMRDKDSRSKVILQSQIQKSIEHPNVVKLIDSFEWEGDFYMIMELCQNNSLKQFLRSRIRITEIEARYYLQQIVGGLQFVHSSGVVHRDIKLGNIFLNYKMEIKIGDFGLSTRLKSSRERRFTTCGTPNYIAPEILSQTGHSYEVDIWAVGIMLYALIIGKPPFQSETVDQTYRRIKHNQFDFPKQIPVSSQAKSLIKLLLEPNPRGRASIQQIRSHQFLTSQKIPSSMPGYTISVPPQSSFLRQYGCQKGAKLSIYPRRVTVCEQSNNSNAKPRSRPKLSRVLSCDKDLFRSRAGSECSTLNKGIILNTKMRNHIAQLPAVPSPQGSRHQQDGNQIICYYDMSAKYGIGYLLSNGNFGVIFNDQTSLTLLSTDQYIYYERKPIRLALLPQSLKKKGQILRLCTQKLNAYKQKNVLICFQSQVHTQSFTKYKDMFVMKLSNGLMHFFWNCDVLTLKGFKWLKWRIGRQQGEAALASTTFPLYVQSKVNKLRQFLKHQSQKSQKKKTL